FTFPHNRYQSGITEKRTQVSRMFISGNRLYTLSVIGEDVDVDDPDVKKFFASFQLEKAPVAPSPKDITGVVAYWSFENLQEFDPNGTLYQAVNQTEGVRGRGAAFEGFGLVKFEQHPKLQFADKQAFSCVGWVRSNSN